MGGTVAVEIKVDEQKMIFFDNLSQDKRSTAIRGVFRENNSVSWVVKVECFS